MKVNEIFASIQGEGRYVGKPQVFVRLTGCNLRCRWCDTRYAWRGPQTKSTVYSLQSTVLTKDSGPKTVDRGQKTVDQIMREIRSHKIRSVCITGGEPMLQKEELKLLVGRLKKAGYEVVLETNGTLYDKHIFEAVDCASVDMKPPSSGEKSDEKILKRLRRKDQVKVVVADGRDLKYAASVIKKSPTEVIIQPTGKRMKTLIKKALDLDLDARIIPQLHKLVGVR